MDGLTWRMSSGSVAAALADAKPENKPSSPRPHGELMVVMADPDTIDEAFGDESDELVDDLGGLNDGEMETLEEGLRPKRKRKRKR